MADLEEHNAALERLAHTTTNKGYSPASPLQALVRRGVLTWLHFSTDKVITNYANDLHRLSFKIHGRKDCAPRRLYRSSLQ